MATRRPNYRLAKIHRSYSVDEVSRLFAVHRNTVREWVRRGLPTNDSKRPMLILGSDLGDFLLARRMKNKRTCQPGEFYCVRCRVPQRPAGDMAEYQSLTATVGNLVGICPECESIINRRVNLSRLDLIRGELEIMMPHAP